MNKVLILGANSTGGAYASYFFSSRGYEVIASSRSAQAHPSQLPYLFNNCPHIKYLCYDLNWDISCQKELLNFIIKLPKLYLKKLEYE